MCAYMPPKSSPRRTASTAEAHPSTPSVPRTSLERRVPCVQAVYAPWQETLFATTWWMLGAWTLLALALALGSLLGALIRRTVAAMAATAATVGGLLAAMHLLLPRLLSFGADVARLAAPIGIMGVGPINGVTQPDWSFPVGSWVVRSWLTGPHGRVLAVHTPAAIGARWIARLLRVYIETAGLSGDQLLVRAPGGGPLVYSNWRQRVWLPSTSQVGLEGLHFHDLRRLNATALVSSGVDVKTTQRRLGHADPRLTLRLYGLFGFERGGVHHFGDEGAPGLRCEPTIKKHLRPR